MSEVKCNSALVWSLKLRMPSLVRMLGTQAMHANAEGGGGWALNLLGNLRLCSDLACPSLVLLVVLPNLMLGDSLT